MARPQMDVHQLEMQSVYPFGSYWLAGFTDEIFFFTGLILLVPETSIPPRTVAVALLRKKKRISLSNISRLPLPHYKLTSLCLLPLSSLSLSLALLFTLLCFALFTLNPAQLCLVLLPI